MSHQEDDWLKDDKPESSKKNSKLNDSWVDGQQQTVKNSLPANTRNKRGGNDEEKPGKKKEVPKQDSDKSDE